MTKQPLDQAFIIGALGVAAGVLMSNGTTTGGGTTGTVSGRVVDSVTGAGIPLIAVVNVGGIAATTDSSGNYVCNNVPQGNQSGTASASGYSPETLSIDVIANINNSLDFSLVAVVAGTGTISGTVKDALTTFGISGGATVSDGTQTTTSGSGGVGAFTLTAVPPGTYTVTATASGYNTATATGVVVTSGVVTSGVALKMTLVSGGAVRGTVVNGSTLLPIAGALVTVGNFSATSDAKGVYAITDIPAGTYTVTASDSGYVAQSNSITVTSGALTVDNFNLLASTTGATATVAPLSGAASTTTFVVTCANGPASAPESYVIVGPASIIVAGPISFTTSSTGGATISLAGLPLYNVGGVGTYLVEFSNGVFPNVAFSITGK